MKLKGIVSVVLVLLLLAGNAQEVIPLYNGMPPGNITTKNTESFSRPKTGRPSVVNVTLPSLTVYVPQHPNAAHSSVVICPGGGYVRLTIEDGGYDVAQALADAGITAFVLKYRTFTDSAYNNYRDLPVQDYQQAIKLIKANASKWNLDVNKIGVMGFSAGGHLATMVSVANNEYKPAFSILAYPVISFTDSLVSKTLKSRPTLLGDKITAADKEYYSPELHVSRTTPPAFMVHAEDDSTSLVGNSITYYKALVRNQVPARLHIYEKGGHGFAIYNKAVEDRWLPAAIQWLSLNGFYTAPISTFAAAPAYWNEIQLFKREDSLHAPAQNSILLTGSSSFTKWKDVSNYFPGYEIINRGFGGSTLPDLIRYAYDAILPYKPKQILIYCGENDLASGDAVTADEVVHRFKSLFGIIRENLPNTTISFVSIKPSPVRANIQPKVKEANKKIKAFLATQKNTQFIDIYDAMLDSKGNMREELYVEDRLHMRPEGYAIWKKIIAPYLKK